MEPETINGYQDDDGCPDAGDPAVIVRADRLELVKPLEFHGDRLKPAAANVIGQIFATLRAHPEIVVLRIAPGVRRGGSPASDYRLSERRGQAIRKALVARGADAKRLEVKPMGSTKASGNKADDDRVDLLILEKR
jgi:outer membrane protein OmpA-like peptidoglycan-associated protein